MTEISPDRRTNATQFDADSGSSVGGNLYTETLTSACAPEMGEGFKASGCWRDVGGGMWFMWSRRKSHAQDRMQA